VYDIALNGIIAWWRLAAFTWMANGRGVLRHSDTV